MCTLNGFTYWSKQQENLGKNEEDYKRFLVEKSLEKRECPTPVTPMLRLPDGALFPRSSTTAYEVNDISSEHAKVAYGSQ